MNFLQTVQSCVVWEFTLLVQLCGSAFIGWLLWMEVNTCLCSVMLLRLCFWEHFCKIRQAARSHYLGGIVCLCHKCSHCMGVHLSHSEGSIKMHSWKYFLLIYNYLWLYQVFFVLHKGLSEKQVGLGTAWESSTAALWALWEWTRASPGTACSAWQTVWVPGTIQTAFQEFCRTKAWQFVCVQPAITVLPRCCNQDAAAVSAWPIAFSFVCPPGLTSSLLLIRSSALYKDRSFGNKLMFLQCLLESSCCGTNNHFCSLFPSNRNQHEMRAVSALQTLDLSGTSEMLFALCVCGSGRIRRAEQPCLRGALRSSCSFSL